MIYKISDLAEVRLTCEKFEKEVCMHRKPQQRGCYHWTKYVDSAVRSYSFHEAKCSIIYMFPDGKQMIEEYDTVGRVLKCRKWKHPSTQPLVHNGKYVAQPWEIEIGSEAEWELSLNYNSELLTENCENPILYRIDSKEHFLWKLKNVPYPEESFMVSVEENQIVIRTTNRKYFNRFRIPDMDRFMYNVKIEDINYIHQNDTLTLTVKTDTKHIQYAKPKEISDNEEKTLSEVELYAIAAAESNPIPDHEIY